MANENEDFDLVVQNRLSEEAKLRETERRAALEKKWDMRMQKAKATDAANAGERGDQIKAKSDPEGAADNTVEPVLDEQGRPVDTDSSAIEDIGMGILGGLRDAGMNILDTGIDIATLGQNDINLAESDFLAVDQRQGALHGAVRGITQFATGFIPALGIVGKLGKLGKISAGLNKAGLGKPSFWRASLKGMTAGLLADASVFDPQEARMSDVLEDGTTFGIDMSNPVTAYLASNEDDSDLEGRFKNAVEGMVMGGIVDSVWYGLRSTKSLLKAHNKAILGSAPSPVADEAGLRTSRVIASTQETSLADAALKEFDEASVVKGDPDIASARAAEAGAAGLQETHAGRVVPAFRDSATGEVKAGGSLHHELDVDPDALDAAIAGRGEGGEDGFGFWDVDEARFLTREEAAARGSSSDLINEDFGAGGTLARASEDPKLTRAEPRVVVQATDGGEAHRFAAEQNGKTLDEHGAPFDERAGAEHPREQQRVEDPETAAALDEAIAGSRQRIVERRAKGMRAIIEARDEFAAFTRTDGWKQMTHAERKGFLDTLEFVPKNLEDEIRAIDAELRKGTDDAAQQEVYDRAILHEPIEEGRSAVVRSDGDFEATMREAVAAEDAAVAAGKPRTLRTLHPEALIEMKRYAEAAVAAGEEVDPAKLADFLAASNTNTRYLGGTEASKLQAQEIEGLVAHYLKLDNKKTFKQVRASATRQIERAKTDLAVEDGKWGQDFLNEAEMTIKQMEAWETTAVTLRVKAAGDRKSLLILGKKMAAEGGLTDHQRLQVIGALDSIKRSQELLHRAAATSGRNLVNYRINLDEIPEMVDAANHSLKASDSAVKAMRDNIAAAEETLGGSIEKILEDMLPHLEAGTAKASRYTGTLASEGVGTFRMFLEGWMSMLLSAPPTQMVNIISTQFVGAYRLGELYIEGAVANVLRGDPTMMLSAQRQASVWMDSQVKLVTMFADQSGDIMKVLNARYTGDVRYKEMIGDFQRKYGTGAHPVANTMFTGESTIAGRGGLAMDLAQDTGQALGRENISALVTERRGSEVEWLKEGTFGGRAVDAVANIWNIPLTALNAMDEAAKYVNYNASLHGEVFEHLYRNTTLRGDALEAKIATMLSSIPNRASEQLDEGVRGLYEQFHKSAVETAKVYTFTDDLVAGTMTKDLHAYTLKHPSTRLVAPFIRTPANLMNYGFERTPGLHMLTSKYKKLTADIKLGKKNGNLDPKLIREMEGMNVRMAMGGAVLTGAVGLAMKGKITGAGPSHPDERAALLATGWQPFSFVVGGEGGEADTYYSYNRADPLGFFFGVIGSYSEIAGSMEDRDMMELAGAVFTATAESFRSKTYVSGISSAVVALSDPRAKFGPWAAQMAGTLIPAGVAHATKTGLPLIGDLTGGGDNTMREVDGMMDKIKSRLPGFSTDLPPRRNIFGEVISHAPGVGPDTMSPFASRRSPNNLVNTEVQRLSQQHGLRVSMRGYDRMGGIELTPAQKDQLITLTGGDPNRNGRNMREDLDKLMRSSKYKRADDSVDGKQALIHELIAKRRARAWKAFLRKNPEVKKQIREARGIRSRAKREVAENASSSNAPASLFASLTNPPDNLS